MKKILGSLLFLASVAACVHAGRKPSSAGVPAMTACQAAFEDVNDEMTVASDRYKSLNKIRKGYEYLQDVYPDEVFALLGKDKPLCERARDFAEIERELKNKIDTVAQTGKMLNGKEKSLSELAVTTMMTDPEFQRKSACVLNCGSNKSGKCADLCSVEQKFIDDLAANELFMRLYNACMPQEPEFRRWLEFHLPNWRKMLKNDLLPHYQNLVYLAQTSRLALRDVQLRLKADKQAEKINSCDLPLPPWKNTARLRVDIVKGPKKQGTAFYITAGGETRVVTADHIYNEEDRWGEIVGRPLVFTGTNHRKISRQTVTREFKPEAGLYSRAADIIQTRLSDFHPAFSLAPTSSVPKYGQSFYMVGYPMVRDYKYTIYRCTFYGYANSEIPRSDAMVYVLRCPDLDGHIAGMSGGPVLDESGRVWGLITDHNPFLARVFVSPLSVDSQAEVKMGIQRAIESDYCVGDGDVEPKPCQVLPQGYGVTGP